MATDRSPAMRVLRRAHRARSMRRPSTRPGDWRTPVGGQAPRLGPRELIGHDIRGRGAWEGRDPLETPRWWSRPHWVALFGWAVLTAGSGYASWRQHGGRRFVFGDSDDR